MRLKWEKKNPPKYSPFLLWGLSWHHKETSFGLTNTAEKPPCQKQELKIYNCQNKRGLQDVPNAGDILGVLSPEVESRWAPPYLTAFIICIYELPKFNGKYKKRLQRHWLVNYFYNCEICSKALSLLKRQSKGQGTNIIKHRTVATVQRGREPKSVSKNLH